MAVELQLETSAHIERHYAVTEIAEMWNLILIKFVKCSKMNQVCWRLEIAVPVTRDAMLRSEFRTLYYSGSIDDYRRKPLSARSVARC